MCALSACSANPLLTTECVGCSRERLASLNSREQSAASRHLHLANHGPGQHGQLRQDPLGSDADAFGVPEQLADANVDQSGFRGDADPNVYKFTDTCRARGHACALKMSKQPERYPRGQAGPTGIGGLRCRQLDVLVFYAAGRAGAAGATFRHYPEAIVSISCVWTRCGLNFTATRSASRG